MTARRDSIAFVQHRRVLLESPAWRTLSLEGHRLIARIEIEHMAHRGKENGDLIIPYADFEDYGVGHRRAIARAITEADALGLLRVVRGRAGNGEFRAPSHYRITYLPSTGAEATDEWREIKTMDEAKGRLVVVKKPRKQSAWLRSKTANVVPFPAC